MPPAPVSSKESADDQAPRVNGRQRLLLAVAAALLVIWLGFLAWMAWVR